MQPNEAMEAMARRCGNCAHWEANGTRFGGRCWSERAQTYGLITSALKTDCPDHTAIRAGEHYALAGGGRG